MQHDDGLHLFANQPLSGEISIRDQTGNVLRSPVVLTPGKPAHLPLGALQTPVSFQLGGWQLSGLR